MLNFPFYEKHMRIQYAERKSDCIAKNEGSFVPREKKKNQEKKGERKRRAKEAQQSAMLNGTGSQSNGGPKALFHHGNLNAHEQAAPNNILFIQNSPHETTSMMLLLLFEQYLGFREVKMIEAKPGIAFEKYEDEEQSSTAMQNLQGFKMALQYPMAITFAKK
ncbi:hypothetical protein REPUB_Repub17cG0014900 [Reevesia pubescens]